MAKLYTLAEKYRVFNLYVENALDSEEEFTDDDIQAYIDTIESIEDLVAVKVENICKFLKNIESDIEGYKKEEDRLKKKRKYLENKFDGLKDYMTNMLEMANLKAVDAGMFKVKFAKTNPSVEVVNEKDVPDKYREKQPDKILKLVMLKDLKDVNVVIPGVIYVTDKQHLRIT